MTDVVSAVTGNGGPASPAPEAGRPAFWHRDPVQLALDGGAAAPDEKAREPFCMDVGRRILLAELEFSRWVLRRVETVSFEEGRSVLRTMTIEFKIREDAPVFVAPAADGEKPVQYWLVPLAIMNRRTLVDFHLCDEEDKPLTLPGLRLTQRLDEAVLLAAAATSTPVTPDIRSFVQRVVAGKRSAVLAAMKEFKDCTPGTDLASLRTGNALFRMALERLRYNFTLYTFLPVAAGRDRLLKMSFVEPITWRYQLPELEKKKSGAWKYTTMKPAKSFSHLVAGLGWTPTRIRFQTPSAENAASYHFEVMAPKGVRIVEATLLAGRPHAPGPPFTADHVRADSLTVGLHAVEVPPNSLCRAQVHLRVQRAGWLTTLLVATAAIFLVLFSVAWHAQTQRAPDPDQDTNVIVLLITTAAAAATFVAQRDFPGVAARLVSWMRGVGVLALALPIAAAGVLSYKEVSSPSVPPVFEVPEAADRATRIWIWALTAVAFLLLVLVVVAWALTRWDDYRQSQTSPWDMTHRAKKRARTRTSPLGRWWAGRMARWFPEEQECSGNYLEALKKFEFRRPAVGVRSSEGWHHRYCWTDSDQSDAVQDLEQLGLGESAAAYACAAPGTCTHARDNGCAVRPVSDATAAGP
jgi:hypothetical protein